MATARETRVADERRLLDGYEVYDRSVDVVSVFEWLHTDPGVQVVPSTVKHFERYPSLTAPDGNQATPRALSQRRLIRVWALCPV